MVKYEMSCGAKRVLKCFVTAGERWPPACVTQTNWCRISGEKPHSLDGVENKGHSRKIGDALHKDQIPEIALYWRKVSDHVRASRLHNRVEYGHAVRVLKRKKRNGATGSHQALDSLQCRR